eukprot:15228545-Ditylum_brightwellii.AAC.1
MKKRILFVVSPLMPLGCVTPFTVAVMMSLSSDVGGIEESKNDFNYTTPLQTNQNHKRSKTCPWKINNQQLQTTIFAAKDAADTVFSATNFTSATATTSTQHHFLACN